MTRRGFVAISFLAVAGCAFPGQVQRIGVDYNTAVGGMANDLTLLNIVRAKEELPLHFTSVSRLSGSLTVKGTSGFNVPLKGASTVATDQDVTSGSSVTTTVIEQVTEGLEVFTPSVGGEVNSGPSFDIGVLDTQEFYQGIMGAVPFSTIENYLVQGFDNQLLIHLFIDRVEFRAQENQSVPKGTTVKTLINRPNHKDVLSFVNEMGCLALGSRGKRSETNLVPVSRITRLPDGKVQPFKLGDLVLVDGKTFEFDKPVEANPVTDSSIMLRRVSAERRVPTLTQLDVCAVQPPAVMGRRKGAKRVALLAEPPRVSPIADYAGVAEVTLVNDQNQPLLDTNNKEIKVKTDIEITFRSPAGVIRHIGAYLRQFEGRPEAAYQVNHQPLFRLTDGRAPRSLATAHLLGRRYAIVDDTMRRRNMTVLALSQELINLHKKSGDRPLTVPVQVVQ